MTAPDIERDPIDAGNERIRDTAKWFIAGLAAVGAALIAGSQLSSIGRLEVGWPTNVATARLWVAVAGASLALAAVVFAITGAVRVLLPVGVLIADLAENWVKPQPGLLRTVRFFQRRPKYLQGVADPQELIDRRQGLVDRLGTPEADSDLNQKITAIDQRIQAIESMANHETLAATFDSFLRRLLAAGIVVAVGIVSFAWAANPPAKIPTADLRHARLTGAFLRDADLRNARLDGADLTDADLTGADLTGASLVKVVWSHTTCPDGTVSDANAGTCGGHLRAK
jgi:Pentapeptide repeats (8 copies)